MPVEVEAYITGTTSSETHERYEKRRQEIREPGNEEQT